MKKVIFSLIAIFSLTSNIQAQDTLKTPYKPSRHDMRLGRQVIRHFRNANDDGDMSKKPLQAHFKKTKVAKLKEWISTDGRKRYFSRGLTTYDVPDSIGLQFSEKPLMVVLVKIKPHHRVTKANTWNTYLNSINGQKLFWDSERNGLFVAIAKPE